jgi:hypothetical protein
MWMARIAILVLASVGCVFGMTRHAAAGVTVDLVFVEHNGASVAPTPTIAASPGDTLKMAILLRNDIAITGFGVSLDFDPGPKDELDVSSAFQWSGVALNAEATSFFSPLIPLEPPSDPGALATGRSQSFHGLAPPWVLALSLPAGGTYQVGTVSWKVTEGVATNGPDIVSGFLKLGFDGLLDGGFDGADSLVQFSAATVNAVGAVPSLSSPGAAVAVGLILAAAVWASARSKR